MNCVTTIVAALALSSMGQPSPFVLRPAAEGPARAGSLLERLQRGDELRIAFFGDSLSYGIGVERPELDGFPALVTRALRLRFPRARIVPLMCADPGAAAWWGLGYLQTHVLPLRPDLVIVQFGGNDAAQAPADRPVETFEQDIKEILWEIRRAGAQAILCIPPYEMARNAQRENRFIDALRRQAAAAEVPLADFNTAMRAMDRDWRGFFPFQAWGHPNWYGHLQMAKELWLALGELAPAECSVTVAVHQRVEIVPAESLVYMPVVVSATQPGEARLSVTFDDQEQTERFKLTDPNKGVLRAFPVTLPPDPLASRPSSAHRIFAAAEVNGAVGFVSGRLTASRVVTCADGPAPPRPPWSAFASHGGMMEESSVRSGGAAWDGPEDCSARFAAFCDGTQIELVVLVRDDTVTVGKGKWLPDNDCVEIALDLNPEQKRGLPYHTNKDVMVLVAPPAAPGGLPQMATLNSFGGAWQFRAAPLPYFGGYGLRISLPLAALSLEKGQQRIGFDVIVDDSDDAAWRQTQLVWSGDPNDALDASRYAVLSMDPADTADLVQLTIR